MSCGEREETKVKEWTWCKKWGIPYPCRRTRTKVRFLYEFHQTRYVPSFFPFWEKREGCCENVVYGWKRYVWWNSPKPFDWNYHDVPVTLSFSKRLDAQGACPPRPGSGGGLEVG